MGEESRERNKKRFAGDRLSDFIFSGNGECNVRCTEENYALVKSWIPEKRENTEGGVLNERLLLKGEECIFYGICS